MFEKLNYIELSGERYPLKCDMLVLEQIQEKYGDLSDFENKLSGFVPQMDEEGEIVRNEEGYMIGTYGTPDLKVVNDALVMMVREGIEIEEEENEKNFDKMTDKQLLRRVDITPKELGNTLHKEFTRCFVRKNKETTQSTKKAEMEE